MIFSLCRIWHCVIPDLIYSAKVLWLLAGLCTSEKWLCKVFVSVWNSCTLCGDLCPDRVTYCGNRARRGAAWVMIRPKVLYPNLTQQISVSLRRRSAVYLRCCDSSFFVKAQQDFYAVFICHWTLGTAHFTQGIIIFSKRVWKWFPWIKRGLARTW